MIETIELRKEFGNILAVNDITLTIPTGELFVMVGPNAAGKTTFFKLIAGLLRPTRGIAKVAGFDVQKDPINARKSLAFVPDFPFLYDKLKPLEMLNFIGNIFKVPHQKLKQNIEQYMSLFNLNEFADKKIENLSHGTKQRIAIACALIHEPAVLVIDEPMVGLDPYYAKVVKDILKQKTKSGMTVLLSTHQLSVAEELGDRIGIMHAGSLITVGNLASLRSKSDKYESLEKFFLEVTASP